ncbi:elymoclavine monooxygenase [Aspergillus coremiiformis]|uniref:Elymoclavine monooxygenase n=1 Tax=Aspergillus coremiiformis TaxID=138285 RepID=A0A5N6Z4E3_9EURO|nr:elymoclavine monooxygenase [Aspergillus coremiiformis]
MVLNVPTLPWLPPFAIAWLTALLIPLGVIIVRRLYIHPLRNVPGPWLAAVSDGYAFYYNFIREGGYSRRILELHREYESEIIRIGPNQVHVNNLDFFEEVFRIGSKYSKDPSFYRHFGGLDGMLHPGDVRIYRNHISSLYSARSADGLVPRLLLELRTIAARLQRNVQTGDAVNIQRMFRTLSADMILQILFPQDVNLFECEGYHPFLKAFDLIMTKTWLMLTYPVVGMVLGLIPGGSYTTLKSAMDEFTTYCEGWAKDAQRLRSARTQPERDSHLTRYLDIDPMHQEKVHVVPHPLQDIFNFLAGGSDTTAYSTSCAVHYLLSSPGVLASLQTELDASAPFIREDFDHKRIQRLPYLNAVVKETLRLSNPVPGCLPRTVPVGGTRLGSVDLPAGTAVSVSLLSVQQNPQLFPQPQTFRPERWLGDEGKAIEKWNVAFSRGPRQCIGTNIAYLELHCGLAYLFSHFEFALAEPGKKLEWVDRFVAANTEDVKVRLVRDRWA